MIAAIELLDRDKLIDDDQVDRYREHGYLVVPDLLTASERALLRHPRLLPVGVMLDDVGEANGPMQVLPGTHRGPVCDHHSAGCFCGPIDPGHSRLDFDSAVPLTGKAGTMTFHHARRVHGSAPNHSNRYFDADREAR